jgi:hypothetical protein
MEVTTISSTHQITKSLVRSILEHPHGRDWTLQGFGMLRLYLDSEHRMHVWDDRYAVRGVTLHHTHPWDFESIVVAGSVENIRFVETDGPDGTEFTKQLILCGEGGGVAAEPERVKLLGYTSEHLREGDRYRERGDEIHVSVPAQGSVTIIRRTYHEDADHAYVYYEDKWVSAEPRKASVMEIEDITRRSLELWFR